MAAGRRRHKCPIYRRRRRRRRAGSLDRDADAQQPRHHFDVVVFPRVLHTYKIDPGVRRVYIFVEKESNTNKRIITFLQLFTTCSI